MTKNGEKLSEMLEFSFYISTSQKSPEVVLLGDDICFQQLAKEISSLIILSVTHFWRIDCWSFGLFATVGFRIEVQRCRSELSNDSILFAICFVDEE